VRNPVVGGTALFENRQDTFFQRRTVRRRSLTPAEKGPGAVSADTFENGVRARLEENQMTGCRQNIEVLAMDESASACGDHDAGPAGQLQTDLFFQPAKVWLALPREDVGDRHPFHLLNQAIRIDAFEPENLGQGLGSLRLPGPHETGDDDSR